MDLGKFSLSLTVKNIEASLDFYTKLGFEVMDGGHVNADFADSETMKWRILENASLKIGLFQGMFEHNIITFSPNDVLSIQEKLKSLGIAFVKEAQADIPGGFVSAILSDPDGNQIMMDQA